MRQSNRVWHLMFFWLSVAVALPAAAAPEQALDVGRGSACSYWRRIPTMKA